MHKNFKLLILFCVIKGNDFEKCKIHYINESNVDIFEIK